MFEQNKIDQSEKSVEFKVGNANVRVIFPHIEDSHFEQNGESVKVFTHDYLKLFGVFCGSQAHILKMLEDYIPKIDWRKRLGEMYFPF